MTSVLETTVECPVCKGFYNAEEILIVTLGGSDCPHCYAELLAEATTEDQKKSIIEILNQHLENEKETKNV